MIMKVKIVIFEMLIQICKNKFKYEYNDKTKCYFKTCSKCRKRQLEARKAKSSTKSSTKSDNDDDNVSCKSSTEQSHISLLNTLQVISNNTNRTGFYNINDDEEQRKPTINEKLDHINMLLDDIKKDMKPTTNDDVELLKSRIDNIEIMMEKQNKLINDMEANIKHCIYQIYCKL